MNRTRPVDALLAALATLSVALPLTSLFASGVWVAPSLLLVLVVAVTGVAARSRARSAWLVGGLQLLAVLAVTGLLFLRDHLWYGLPGPGTVRAAWLLLADAYENVQTHSAPAPVTPGTTFALAGLIALTAVAVDLLAATLRSPSLAGLPLLAAYLSAATNSGAGLGAIYFVIPAALWVTMVGRQGVLSIRRWATAVSRSDAEHPTATDADDVVLDFASLGRVLGVGTIAVAVVLTSFIPHLPTTFLAHGLGRASGAGAGSGIRLESTLDLTKDLGDRSSDPVIVYKAPLQASQTPLRVDVLTTYENGEWSPPRRRVVTPTDGTFPSPPPATVASSTPTRMQIVENKISAPQLALPELTTHIAAGTAPLSVDFNGVVRVRSRVPTYTADFLTLAPRDSDFSGDGRGLVSQSTLAPDPASLPAVRAALAEAVPAGSDSLATARAIQSYLRSPAFSYSLTLAPSPAGADPITAFLVTKTGYCVQFATAMVMMARASGIPARIAIGFLPGHGTNGEYTVVARDAHAWPELFFPKLGWVRFEPTPGSRAGAAPGYTIAPVTPVPTATATAATPTAAPSPTSRAGAQDTPNSGTAVASPAAALGQWVSDHAVVLGALTLLLALALLLPLGGWARRRGRRRRAADAAARAEAEWQSLLARLSDVGIAPPPGATPRQTGRYLREAAYLGGEPEQALGRVVATIERGRYAVPTADLPEVRSDVREVWRAASRTRSRSLRFRAVLVPSDGVRAWGGWADGLLAAPRWVSRLLRRALSPRRRSH